LYILTDSIKFPPLSYVYEDGLLAVGGDLSVPRLLEAYANGIFPWYNQDQPILWFCPDPRMVLFTKELKISKSMRQLLRKDEFKVTFNQNFEAVIQACSSIKRPEQEGTWITNEMKNAYTQLFKMGESMFTKTSNASKYGFIKLVQWLIEKEVRLIDCQVHTNHLESLGAREISREVFLGYLK